MIVFAFFFHMEGRRQPIWMTVAASLMLTLLTGVLAGLDHLSQRPLGIGPDSMRILRAHLGHALGLHVNRAFCRDVPITA